MNQTDETIRNVQEEVLRTLIIIHEFFTSHNIKYSLHGGTLIGAIREHGFIEWDDDADLSITRSYYKRFLKAYADDWKEEDIKFDEIRRKFFVNRKGHPKVWIDLFIYDYISANVLAQKVKIAGIGFFLALIRTPEMLITTKARGKYKGWKFALMKVISSLGQLIPEKKKYQMLSRQHQRFSGKRQYIHRSNDQFHGVKEILPKETMENYILVSFENTKLMVSSQYDIILRRSFGDYMTPVKMEDDVKAHEMARVKMQRGNKK